ncbi:MAG: amidohydrolase family protein [Bacteriovoracaceae bacterium]|jgi:guanine deaminase|nr:amidohydrolase family protein [Bacteriovoracaceae bacterium]
MKKVILANILNPLSDKKCEFIKDGAMILKPKNNGFVIEKIGQASKLYKEFDNVNIVDLSDKVIMPTFFDMHFHWVQDDVRMMPKANLLEWLDKYTFVAENRFKNKTYAKKRAKEFFERIVKTGTLGGACYSSIHEHALDYAFEYATGDFVIGNVLMTINSPKFLTQKPKEATKLADKLSKKYKKKYALTPRFAIATDPVTMSDTAKAAKKNKSFIQTHLSETKNEIDFVTSIYKEMKGFEKIKTYTDIYKKCGVLSSKTIMGHGIHLSKEELATLSKTKTAIAHCPTSNAPHKELGLGSGLFNFKLVEKNNIRWALGSDIGGGPFLSMLDVMRSFVAQNKKAKVSGATYVKALFRSTMSGAQILKLDKKKGNFLTGKEANFVSFDMPKLTAKNLNSENILKKIIESSKNDRSAYDALAQDVFFLGHKIH